MAITSSCSTKKLKTHPHFIKYMTDSKTSIKKNKKLFGYWTSNSRSCILVKLFSEAYAKLEWQVWGLNVWTLNDLNEKMKGEFFTKLVSSLVSHEETLLELLCFWSSSLLARIFIELAEVDVVFLVFILYIGYNKANNVWYNDFICIVVIVLATVLYWK